MNATGMSDFTRAHIDSAHIINNETYFPSCSFQGWEGRKYPVYWKIFFSYSHHNPEEDLTSGKSVCNTSNSKKKKKAGQICGLSQRSDLHSWNLQWNYRFVHIFVFLRQHRISEILNFLFRHKFFISKRFQCPIPKFDFFLKRCRWHPDNRHICVDKGMRWRFSEAW